VAAKVCDVPVMQAGGPWASTPAETARTQATAKAEKEQRLRCIEGLPRKNEVSYIAHCTRRYLVRHLAAGRPRQKVRSCPPGACGSAGRKEDIQTPDTIDVAVLNGPLAGVAKLADARDSKSRSLNGECGFDSLLRHFRINELRASTRAAKRAIELTTPETMPVRVGSHRWPRLNVRPNGSRR
jgi:hypothetical protein